MSGITDPQTLFWNAQGKPTYVGVSVSPQVAAKAAEQAAPAPSGGGTYYGGGYNYAAQAAAQAAAQRAAQEHQINVGYDTYNSGLQDIIGHIAPQNDATNQQIESSFNTSKGQLDNQLARTQNKLNTDVQTVETQKKSGLNNLAQQFGRQLTSGNIMLGARGAGDSSATGQAALALAEAQSRSRAGVLGQANENVGQIDLQRVNAQKSHDDLMGKFEEWRSNQIEQAFKAYSDIRTSIEREQAGANLERRNTLAQLAVQAAQALQGKLGQIQSNFVQASKEVQNRLSQNPIPQIADNLFQAQEQFQPNPIQVQGLPGITFGGNQPNTPGYTANPLFVKKDETTTGF